jgi:putative FmdB family regulatory protein
MPIYEYVCLDCGDIFEALRPMHEADKPIVCENCESEHTSRKLAVLFAQSGGRPLASNSTGGCGGCSGGSCSSCRN